MIGLADSVGDNDIEVMKLMVKRIRMVHTEADAVTALAEYRARIREGAGINKGVPSGYCLVNKSYFDNLVIDSWRLDWLCGERRWIEQPGLFDRGHRTVQFIVDGLVYSETGTDLRNAIDKASSKSYSL